MYNLFEILNLHNALKRTQLQIKYMYKSKTYNKFGIKTQLSRTQTTDIQNQTTVIRDT